MSEYNTLTQRFVAVATARTLQEAAETLSISQPALTQSIKKIEAIHGSQLFERTKKGMVLTVAGKLLLKRSSEILRQAKLAQMEIEDVLHGGAGTLRIAAGTAWGHCFLPKILSELQTEFDGLRVELDIALTEQALPRLIDGDVDLVLGAMNPDFSVPEPFQSKPLIQLNFAAGCGPNSDLAERDWISVAELAGAPIVVYEDDEQLMKRVIKALEKEAGCEFKIAMKTKSLLAALEMVATGRYIVFLVEPFLSKIPGMGVRILNLNRELHSFQTNAYYRESLTRTRPFRKLLSEILKVGK